jgi:drug/metabolite transporter (DMT)-like permease
MLVPLASALGYTLAALMMKRGTEGAGPWRVSCMVNWVQAALCSLLFLLPNPEPATTPVVLHAVINGAIFFVGQIFTFLALHRGDVSVTTPVLGSKVIFVAIFAALLGREQFTQTVWIAVLLTAVATALLSGGGGTHAEPGRLVRSVLYGFCAAAAYALGDVWQQEWVRLWGFNRYVPAVFLTVAVLSFALVPFFRGSLRDIPASSLRWTVAGGACLAVQACGVAWGIMTLGATTTNVLYNSRGLWSVVLVWTIGGWFGNVERAQGRAVLFRRLGGSLLLLAAIFLITRRP